MALFSPFVTICKSSYRYFVPAHKYELLARLYGHRDSIFAVEATRMPDGKMLIASAGKDGLYIWELPSMTSVPTPEPMHPKRGAPTSLAWGTNEKDTCDFLVSGTVNGYLCIMKRIHGSKEFVEVFSEQLSSRAELVSVKCDLIEKAKDTIRIVNASADGTIQAWTYDSLNRLLPSFSIRVDGIIPRSAVFTSEASKHVSVLGVTAGRERVGVLVTLNSSNGEVTRQDRIGGAAGVATAAVDDYRGYFAVDNGESTFDLCSLKNGNLIKSFTFRSREVDCRLPLQVAFVGDGRFIAGGSDHGVAYVYERKSANVFDVLHHALHDDAIVQTISAFEYSGVSFVFTATSGRSRYPYISVWRYGARTKISARQPQNKRRSCLPAIWSVMRWIIKLALVATFATLGLFVMSAVQELDAFNHARAYFISVLAGTPEYVLSRWIEWCEQVRLSLQNIEGID